VRVQWDPERTPALDVLAVPEYPDWDFGCDGQVVGGGGNCGD
jgi:hypothetical protein